MLLSLFLASKSKMSLKYQHSLPGILAGAHNERKRYTRKELQSLPSKLKQEVRDSLVWYSEVI